MSIIILSIGIPISCCNTFSYYCFWVSMLMSSFFMLPHVQKAHHSIIDDSEIIVDYNRQQLMPGWIPRRLGQLTSSSLNILLCYVILSFWNSLILAGGGLGGKKESGQLRFGGRERPFRAPLYAFSTLFLGISGKGFLVLLSSQTVLFIPISMLIFMLKFTFSIPK